MITPDKMEIVIMQADYPGRLEQLERHGALRHIDGIHAYTSMDSAGELQALLDRCQAFGVKTLWLTARPEYTANHLHLLRKVAATHPVRVGWYIETGGDDPHFVNTVAKAVGRENVTLYGVAPPATTVELVDRAITQWYFKTREFPYDFAQAHPSYVSGWNYRVMMAQARRGVKQFGAAIANIGAWSADDLQPNAPAWYPRYIPCFGAEMHHQACVVEGSGGSLLWVYATSIADDPMAEWHTRELAMFLTRYRANQSMTLGHSGLTKPYPRLVLQQPAAEEVPTTPVEEKRDA